MSGLNGNRLTLRDFRNRLAPRETLWLRDEYSGRIIGRSWKRLRRFQNVTVTGCYPALRMDEDASGAQCVLVCWGKHGDIEAARRHCRGQNG